MMTSPKDLSKEPARSPRVRIGGYLLLARMADKGRATIAGTAGEYHFDCPVDNILFGFKGVKGSEVKPLLASGASDDEIAAWLDTHGTPKTAAEITAWGDSIMAMSPYNDPAKKEWFTGECVRLGLNSATATFCDYLDADDRASFPNRGRGKSFLLIGLDPFLLSNGNDPRVVMIRFTGRTFCHPQPSFPYAPDDGSAMSAGDPPGRRASPAVARPGRFIHGCSQAVRSRFIRAVPAADCHVPPSAGNRALVSDR